MRRADPSRDRFARLLGDLKLHRPLRLLLHDNRASGDMTALHYVVHAKPDQVAPTQLAIDGEVEKRKLSGSMIQLQANPDRPDFLQLQRWLLPSSFPLFHGTRRPSALGAVLVAACMSGSFIGGKEPHVDTTRRTPVDPI
jgi:hypothetical protein